MGHTADTGESVALDDALESLTLGGTDDIDELDVSEDIFDRQGVAQAQFLSEILRELDEFAHRSGTCLLEMALKRRAGMLLCGFVIGKLDGGVPIGLNRLNLRNNTWTSLNDGAWNIFSISTENGSHSDFLSN
jgi:hypothetical protein